MSKNKKSKNEQRWVYADYTTPGSGFSYVSLEDAVKTIQEALEAQKRGEWRGLRLEIDDEYGGSYIKLRGQRLETAAEKAKREEHEKGQEAYQRHMYEELKRKFESKKD